jgi:hypothetical protein
LNEIYGDSTISPKYLDGGSPAGVHVPEDATEEESSLTVAENNDDVEEEQDLPKEKGPQPTVELSLESSGAQRSVA